MLKAGAKVGIFFQSAKFLRMFFMLLLMQMPYTLDFTVDGDVIEQRN
jgi:hypothetical protein